MGEEDLTMSKSNTVGQFIKKVDGTPKKVIVLVRKEQFLIEGLTHQIKSKEDYDSFIDLRKVVFNKFEVDDNIVFEVDRRKDGRDERSWLVEKDYFSIF